MTDRAAEDTSLLEPTVGTQAPTGPGGRGPSDHPLAGDPLAGTPRFPRPPRPGSSHHGSTTVGSPLEALERDEILRTRRFCFIGAVIAVAGVLTVPLLPGDPTAAALVVIAVAISLVAIAFLLSRTSDPVKFRARSTALGWFVPAVCATSGIPFFGAFSPVPLVLVLGIYFTGLGKSRFLAFGVYAICAGAQLIVSLLVIGGAIRDTGIVRATDLSRSAGLLIQLLVQIVLLGTYVTARFSRRTALLAVGELERAVRIAAHREALLFEAREELERALRAGRGRFSDQTLGNYKLGTLIGRGAMGEVYAATDARGIQVAIKLLSQTSLGNPNHVRRFLRELKNAAGLESPHIVRVLDVGDAPVPYLVMERLEGQTLGEILRGKRALRPEEVVDMVRQVGIGITAAAAAGIIHRDLKPQNVFNDRQTWKILDFGVSRAADHGDTLTSGGVVGTPSYMAPEQASGGTVDHCTDLYALTAVAYRATTGYPPFAAGEIAETLYRVVHTAPRRPTEIASDLPLDVDLVLAIGLAKRPEHRFTSANELAEALADAFVGALPQSLRDRATVLVRNGAWSGETRSTRASTNRMRVPRPR